MYELAQLQEFATGNIAIENAPDGLKEILQNWWNDSDSFAMQTSGSTGTPKTIFHLKKSIVASAKLTAAHFKLKKGTSALCCLPLAYVAGKMMVLRALVNDWDLHFSTTNSTPLEYIESDIQFAAMVPMQLEKSLEKTPLKIAKIDTIIVGGAPVGKALRGKILPAQNKIYATYGMTETLTHVATQLLSGSSAQSHFETLAGCFVSESENGTLQIETAHLPNGPFVTNDVAEILSHTQFNIMGRADDVINSGGIKLHPQKIEEKLNTIFPFQFYLIASPHERLGQCVGMVLILPAQELNIKTLQKKMLPHLEKFELPKHFYPVSKFEATASGKIKRTLPPFTPYQ